MMKQTFFVLLSGVLCAAAMACGEREPAAVPLAQPAAAAATQPPGRVRGTVKLRGSLPEQRSEPITKDQNVCGSQASLTRLALGKDNAVRHAFVYLEGIASLEQARPRLSTEVEQKDCAYGPHVATVSAGAQLEIVNHDPILHNVHALTGPPDALQTVFNIAQPIRGQRTKVDAPLNKPGIIELKCEAGHPWMSAYILVADHPYVATTSDAGEFVIEGVPPGTYPITMWHEGVQLKRIIPSLQQFEYEEPYEVKQEVVVPANGEVVVDFELELRTGN